MQLRPPGSTRTDTLCPYSSLFRPFRAPFRLWRADLDVLAAILIVAMLAIGLALGWFAGNRGAAAMRAERDARAEDFRKAIIDLAGAEERARAVDGLRAELVALRNERSEWHTSEPQSLMRTSSAVFC